MVMQSRVSQFRRWLQCVGFLALGVMSTCYIAEVEAGRVSLTFRGTVVSNPFLPNVGYLPESGVVSGMPVEGEVWWNDEEPTDLARTVDGEAVYVWGNSPGAAHGFGVKIGRHTMISESLETTDGCG
jgi:hypothetical protein